VAARLRGGRDSSSCSSEFKYFTVKSSYFGRYSSCWLFVDCSVADPGSCDSGSGMKEYGSSIRGINIPNRNSSISGFIDTERVPLPVSQGHHHQGPEPGERAAGRAGSHQADLPVRVGQRGTTSRRRRYTGQIRRSRGIPQRQYKIRRQSKYLCVRKVTCYLIQRHRSVVLLPE
jgi:hypothetical protein